MGHRSAPGRPQRPAPRRPGRPDQHPFPGAGDTGDAHPTSLRALLAPLGVPIRDQLAIDGTNKPGIHHDDWAAWITTHGGIPASRQQEQHHPGSPARAGKQHGGEATPTREAPLPHEETTAQTDPIGMRKPQVSAGDLVSRPQDLDVDLGGSERGPAPEVTPLAELLLRHTRTAIGTARGTHLRDILARVQAAGHFAKWNVTRLRRELEAVGIQVEDQLWLNGRNTRGVLAESLPTTSTEETVS
ncbi:hypothetical protein GCM10010405_54680 [Streptomyces macrosporus]|uniref:Uncharacterized protein n=1 Tax=Streptomyces macrosporus TaxID=44032 RepID=A0ABN3KMX2_9ACTN